MSEAFGRKLRDLRKRAGLTQAQLGVMLGLNLRQVSKLETGRYQPTWAAVQKVVRALRARYRDLEDENATEALPEPESGPGPGRPRKNKRVEE